MKKVVTFGVFDFFHLGHLRLFKNIRRLAGEPCFLIVATQDGDCLKKYKPEAKVLYSTDERKEILESLREIDKVVVYTFSNETLEKLDFDILAVGPDQTNPSFQKCFEYCKEHGKRVMIVPRTEGICSSDIKNAETLA